MYNDNDPPRENRAAGTLRFVVDGSFDSALNRIRRTLADDHLCVAAEIDVKQRIKQSLDMKVPRCRVLLVDNPGFMLEIGAVNRASGIFVPLHLVVSAIGDRTLVYLLNLDHVHDGDLPMGVKRPLIELHHQVGRSIGKIADVVCNAPEQPDGDGQCSRVALIDLNSNA